MAVVAGLWALLIGTGLGSTDADRTGRVCFVGRRGYAARGGAGLFALREPRHRGGRRDAVPLPLPPLRRSIRRSTRRRRRPSTRCWRSSGARSIRLARRWTIPPCRPAPAIPGGRSRLLAVPARSTTSSGSTGSGPRRCAACWGRCRSARWSRCVFASLGPPGTVRAAAQRSGRLVAAVHALAGDRARPRALHEFPARLRAAGSISGPTGRSRGPGARLLLRGELHRVGHLGRHRAGGARAGGRRPGRAARRARRRRCSSWRCCRSR